MGEASSTASVAPDPAAAGHRPGSIEDVALAAVLLASDSAARLTGVTLDVAGGYVTTCARTANNPQESPR
jgi:hypothetical protein